MKKIRNEWPGAAGVHVQLNAEREREKRTAWGGRLARGGRRPEGGGRETDQFYNFESEFRRPAAAARYYEDN
ncbi:hypothetical protein EVAR_92358_1 [Eumeta japonica]|uniref:Uncharacterized protein n=1 Tax=Eumeta variegata TaxID=151549 RepID=A0A4C1TJU5_EUMVA|nr:hypothetical protein EVAR_92358_1 [Eumeta japonica]